MGGSHCSTEGTYQSTKGGGGGSNGQPPPPEVTLLYYLLIALKNGRFRHRTNQEYHTIVDIKYPKCCTYAKKISF